MSRFFDSCVRFLFFLLAFSQTLSLQADGAVKKLDEVEEYIVRERDPDVYQGKDKSGVAILGALIEVSHHRGPWRFSKSLNGWVHQKNLILLSEAIEQFSEEIQDNPDPMLYHLRGIAYMAREDWGRAVNDLEEAYELGDASTMLHINLGTSLLNLGLIEKAEQEFTKVIESYPDQAIAFQSRGDLYIDLQDYEKALADLKKASELAPKSAETYNSIGVALRMTGQFEKAIQAYSQAIEFDENLMSAFLNRGYAYKSIGAFQKALADYEKALELDSNSPSVKNDLAWLLATCKDSQIRDPDRAVKLALEACRVVEYRKGDYVDTLAAAYARQGNYPKAVETAQSAIELLVDEDSKVGSQERLTMYRAEKPYTDSLSSE